MSLFLDLRKAFDAFNHDILLTKLEKYGIIQKELTWFISHITCRTQYCYLIGKKPKKTGSHLQHSTRVMFGTSSVRYFYE